MVYKAYKVQRRLFVSLLDLLTCVRMAVMCVQDATQDEDGPQRSGAHGGASCR